MKNGVFLYSSTDADGEPTKTYIHFEALLVKRKGSWKMMMEYQKSKAMAEEWEKLE